MDFWHAINISLILLFFADYLILVCYSTDNYGKLVVVVSFLFSCFLRVAIMFFETTHEVVTDYLELKITLVHTVDVDSPSWEGVEFGSATCLQSNKVFYNLGTLRGWCLKQSFLPGQAIRAIDKLVDQTEYRFDSIMNEVEKL